jgi:hypothetical protein
MKHRISLTYLVALLGVSGLMAQVIPVQERVLLNGMRVILVERSGEPSISFGWAARVGSADEPRGITGIAHLFEHVMFKGTRVIGTRDAVRDGELNREQDRVVATIREGQDLLRERLRRGEIQNIGDPNVRTPRLQAALDKLVREQRELIITQRNHHAFNSSQSRRHWHGPRGIHRCHLR